MITYIYTRIYICVYSHVFVYICIYVCIYIHICVCVKYPLLSAVSKGTSSSGAATVVIKMNNTERM